MYGIYERYASPSVFTRDQDQTPTRVCSPSWPAASRISSWRSPSWRKVMVARPKPLMAGLPMLAHSQSRARRPSLVQLGKWRVVFRAFKRLIEPAATRHPLSR